MIQQVHLEILIQKWTKSQEDMAGSINYQLKFHSFGRARELCEQGEWINRFLEDLHQLKKMDEPNE